jgi:hypothetical protein
MDVQGILGRSQQSIKWLDTFECAWNGSGEVKVPTKVSKSYDVPG